jgi:hypothetical protein
MPFGGRNRADKGRSQNHDRAARSDPKLPFTRADRRRFCRCWLVYGGEQRAHSPRSRRPSGTNSLFVYLYADEGDGSLPVIRMGSPR